MKRALDPIDRVSEVLFGLIMVLSFTGSMGVVETGREDVRSMRPRSPLVDRRGSAHGTTLPGDPARPARLVGDGQRAGRPGHRSLELSQSRNAPVAPGGLNE
jgi:hypothetical protein